MSKETVPSRVIREGWLESERVNLLKPDEERFFLRLILRADDFGRYHGNHALLKSNLFPLREDVRSTDIPRLIAACEKAGLVRCYEHDGKRYVEIPRFAQRMRASVSKFPDPPADDWHPPDPCPSDDGPPLSEAEARSESESGSKTDARAGGQTSVIPLFLNTIEFQSAWNDWLQHRREKKDPVGPGSQTEKQQLKTLEEWGEARSVAAIRFTIFKGWKGLREPEEKDIRELGGKPVPWQRDSHNVDHSKGF